LFDQGGLLVDDAQRQRAALLREQAMRARAEENQRMALEASIDRCDKCPKPKQEYDRELSLPNGIRLSLYCHRCESPDANCTALVQSHLPSEPPAVANRIVEWLAERPELKAIGVSWVACLHWEADRLILTYRTPVEERVIAAVGAVAVEEFRGSAEPGAALDTDLNGGCR
jgi:hypothetical protein